MLSVKKDVCIVGAGPAGMILGLLLAKQGLQVLVLESHKDFAREYRGEVLMPRFTQMMRQMGLFDYLTQFPHLKLTDLEGLYQGEPFFKIGFDQIAPEAPFALWMPQTILLEALHQKAKSFPNFEIWFDAQAEDLIEKNNHAVGVSIVREKEKIEVRAKVTVGADGRFSVIRKRGGFNVADEQHKFDLIWFTVEKPAGYDNKVRFFISPKSNYLILPKYPNHIQCGLVVEKGGFARHVKAGIHSMREVLLSSHSMFHDFAKNLRDFKPFNVLQAKIEYVQDWAKNGAVLVGDSAHTCSPAGAIGVSVATATAIVAADVIRECFEKNDFSKNALSKIQRLREKEVRHIQSRQKAFTFLLIPGVLGPFRFVALFMAALFTKFRILRIFQRDLLVMKEPLPVSEKIKLD